MFNFLDLGNVNQTSISKFESLFGKEQADKARAEIAREKAERGAMPRNDKWLLEEIYCHVDWHEYGCVAAMAAYAEQVNRRWHPNMDAAETEALKKELIGY